MQPGSAANSSNDLDPAFPEEDRGRGPHPGCGLSLESLLAPRGAIVLGMIVANLVPPRPGMRVHAAVTTGWPIHGGARALIEP